MRGIEGLHVLTDQRIQSRHTHVDLARFAAAGGSAVIQLRDKSAPDSEMIETGCAIREIAWRYGVLFFVNDRPDVAVACGADGVHLGSEDAAVSAARALMGADRVIGASAGNPEVARAREAEGADYLGTGPVYSTGSKSDARPAIGPEGLRSVVKAVKIPVIAIGGITAESVPEVLAAGARGVAVISAVCGRDDPEQAAKRIVRRIELYRSGT